MTYEDLRTIRAWLSGLSPEPPREPVRRLLEDYARLRTFTGRWPVSPAPRRQPPRRAG